MLSEISQGKKRQIPYDLTYMWNLNKQTKMDSRKQKRLVVARGNGMGVRKWMKAGKRYKPPAVTGVLGMYVQHPDCNNSTK